jgi:hypothetical protein
MHSESTLLSAFIWSPGLILSPDINPIKYRIRYDTRYSLQTLERRTYTQALSHQTIPHRRVQTVPTHLNPLITKAVVGQGWVWKSAANQHFLRMPFLGTSVEISNGNGKMHRARHSFLATNDGTCTHGYFPNTNTPVTADLKLASKQQVR